MISCFVLFQKACDEGRAEYKREVIERKIFERDDENGLSNVLRT